MNRLMFAAGAVLGWLAARWWTLHRDPDPQEGR